MILKILHLSVDIFCKIFNKLIDERLEKVTDLDERVNRDDLISRYKGNVAGKKFNEFDNALDIINEIRDDKRLGWCKKIKKNLNII